jgi:hypothetical protein
MTQLHAASVRMVPVMQRRSQPHHRGSHPGETVGVCGFADRSVRRPTDWSSLPSAPEGGRARGGGGDERKAPPIWSVHADSSRRQNISCRHQPVIRNMTATQGMAHGLTTRPPPRPRREADAVHFSAHPLKAEGEEIDRSSYRFLQPQSAPARSETPVLTAYGRQQRDRSSDNSSTNSRVGRAVFSSAIIAPKKRLTLSERNFKRPSLRK